MGMIEKLAKYCMGLEFSKLKATVAPVFFRREFLK